MEVYEEHPLNAMERAELHYSEEIRNLQAAGVSDSRVGRGSTPALCIAAGRSADDDLELNAPARDWQRVRGDKRSPSAH